MRVAIVAPEHPLTPRHGGIARYLRDYVPALARQVEVMLISIEPGPALEGVPQTVVGMGRMPAPLAPPWRSRRCLAALRRFAPDVVEYSNWLALSCADTGPWCKVMRLSTPVAFGTLRPGIMPRLAHPLHLFWEHRALKRIDHGISHTAANVETCLAAYGALPPCTVIPLGVDLAHTQPAADAADVLFVGRFETRKGLDVLLRAWAQVVRAPGVPEQVTLHLVGRDTVGHGGESFLQQCLAGAALPANRLKVHGSLAAPELEALRRRCAMCVVPSRYESFGLVVLEAFAAGQAVVASRVGGLAEVIRDGLDGVLVAPENADALANALVRVISDRTFSASLAAAGRLALRGRFSVGQMVERSLAVYKQVVDKRHAAATA